MSSTVDTSTDTQLGRRIGQVKWFNNKAGYGFITVTGDESNKNDVFIHFSSIRVTNTQYKYLIQGEYVEFNLVKSTTDTHEFQANDVSGINGGSLMCETRRSYQQNDNDASSGQVVSGKRERVSTKYTPKPRTRDESAEFTTVRRRKPPVEKKTKYCNSCSCIE